MRIHIVYKTREEPWGGGNQFIKALQKEFEEKGVYEKDITKTTHFLFNSHHYLRDVLKLKLRYPLKIFLHRVDGPISLIRERDVELDKLIFKFSQAIADVTIFQSNWSYNQSKALGFQNNRFMIIYNASNPKIFNSKNKKPFNRDGRIRLIATSWSNNWRKGFEIYNYLDKNLDFDRYEFTFIGNSPIKFENIKHIMPLPSNDLSNKLKNSDIYITASKNDPCSNSLIEAMNCGLPALVLEDGGHPELVGKGGETFKSKEEIFMKLEKIISNYSVYQSKIATYKISEIADQYIAAFETVDDTNGYVPKKINIMKYFTMLLQLKLSGH